MLSLNVNINVVFFHSKLAECENCFFHDLSTCPTDENHFLYCMSKDGEDQIGYFLPDCDSTIIQGE